jgi:hypothetical protein
MAESTVTGQVHLIEPTKSFGQKGFRKRLVVLQQTRGKFTNYVPLDFVGDACAAVDDMKVGDTVTVSYRLAGRKWQRDEGSEVRFFLSAEATGFEFADSNRPASRPVAIAEDRETGYDAADDDAPF